MSTYDAYVPKPEDGDPKLAMCSPKNGMFFDGGKSNPDDGMFLKAEGAGKSEVSRDTSLQANVHDEPSEVVAEGRRNGYKKLAHELGLIPKAPAYPPSYMGKAAGQAPPWVKGKDKDKGEEEEDSDKEEEDKSKKGAKEKDKKKNLPPWLKGKEEKTAGELPPALEAKKKEKGSDGDGDGKKGEDSKPPWLKDKGDDKDEEQEKKAASPFQALLGQAPGGALGLGIGLGIGFGIGGAGGGPQPEPGGMMNQLMGEQEPDPGADPTVVDGARQELEGLHAPTGGMQAGYEGAEAPSSPDFSDTSDNDSDQALSDLMSQLQAQ